MRKIISLLVIAVLVAAPTVSVAKSTKKSTKRHHKVKKAPKVVSTGDWRLDIVQELGRGSIYVQDATGQDLLSYEVDTPMVPASTIKVATAAVALKYFGPEYRFPTDFFYHSDGTLIIKGYGDPSLTSEDLHQIAKVLKQRGVKRITKLRLDGSYFGSDVSVDGHDGTFNPYDAGNGALVVNYNTAAVQVSGSRKHRVVSSADPLTPLTTMVEARAKRLPNGRHRINMGTSRMDILRFAGESIAAILQQEGISVEGEIVAGAAPGTTPTYRHLSSTTLRGIVIGMLEFSNNFTANQLFLATGAAQMGAPATVAKADHVMTEFLKHDVGWTNFEIAEGSGLSRQNKVTARDMMKLLRYFKPYQQLMPVKEEPFQAKTGTLNGVSTYAGYFPVPGGGEISFVILANGNAPYALKFKIAKQLYKGIVGSPVR